MNLKRLSQFGSPILGLLLFGVSLWAIATQLREFDYRDIFRSLAEIPKSYIVLALICTALNYLMLTGYDALAMRYIRRSIPFRKVALTAIISQAITNTAGLELLTGSAIRYRFYSAWGLSTLEIAKVITFCHVSFWLGFFAVSGFVLIGEPVSVPSLLRIPSNSLFPLGTIFLFLVAGYLLWNTWSHKPMKLGKWGIPRLPGKLSLFQTAIAILDWAIAGGVLYVLLLANAPLSYPSFFGIYILGQLAGVISNVPGGLGVFETVLLLSLSAQIPSAELFGALLAYRGIYYFLPLIVAIVLLGIYELRQRFEKTEFSPRNRT
jgi:glycosyltransferase 2 family protein